MKIQSFRNSRLFLQNILKSFETFHKNYNSFKCKLTIESGYDIVPYSIQSTSKLLFCARCLTYCCNLHGAQNYNDYFDSYQKLDFQEIQDVVHFYNLIDDFNSKEINKEELIQNPCSSYCYKNIKSKEEFGQINIDFFNKIQLATMKKYISPCKLKNYSDRQISCQQAFAYLICYNNLLQKYKEQVTILFKKKKEQKRHFIQFERLERLYQPCVHTRSRQNDLQAKNQQTIIVTQDLRCKECNCKAFGFCDKFCLCDPNICSIQRKGCQCTSDCTEKGCPCSRMNIECDPEICSCIVKKNCCRNIQITLGLNPKTKIKLSTICEGLGLFIDQPVKKNDLIIIYYGEILTSEENEIREKWDNSQYFYAFTVLQASLLVEAKYFANKARFINHSKSKPNCYSRQIYSAGDFHIALYAQRDIECGEELFFDYDLNNDIDQVKYPWIVNTKTLPRNNGYNIVIKQSN